MWYAKTLLPAPGAGADVDPAIAAHVSYCARTSRRLARRLFRAMARHGTAIEREQVLLGRFVDVGTEVFALSASCSRAQRLLASGTARAEVMPVLDLFAEMARERIENAFRGTRANHDAAGYALAQDVLAGKHAWLER